MARPSHTSGRNRSKAGLFGSLTPAFYLAALVAAVMVAVSVWMLLSGEDEAKSEHKNQASVGSEFRDEPSEDQPPFAVKEKIVLPEQETSPARSATETNATAAPLVEQEEQGGEQTELLPSPADAGTEPTPPAVPVQTAPAPAKPLAKPDPEASSQAPTPSPAATPVPDALLDGRWVVQLSVNRRADLAREWADRINALELDATASVMKRETGSGTLHVLLMGRFASEQEAHAMARTVGSRLGLTGAIVREVSPWEVEHLAGP